MVSGVHFLSDKTAWPDVGWKSLAVNLSDIAAMGARPHLALVTLMLPTDYLVEDALALYSGLNEAAQAYGVTLGGGDIVQAPAFAITVALSGWAATSALGEPVVMTRDAARIGDVVAVSGCLGDGVGGLTLLRDDTPVDDDVTRYLHTALTRPQPRLELAKAAVGAGVRCAIDVSDGFLQDVGHIARASEAGIRIDANRIPISDELHERFPGRALGFALTGGEDYELVLIGHRGAIEALIGKTETPLTEVGEVVEYDTPRVAVVDETGREIPIGKRGWDHFADA
jgi:thiamine-monophosphate kinase